MKKNTSASVNTSANASTINTRDFTDINILSHIFMIFPLCYHIYYEKYYMGLYSFIMIILSIKYHRSRETEFVIVENTLAKIYCLCLTYQCITISKLPIIHFVQGILCSTTLWIFILGYFDYSYHHLIHLVVSIWAFISQ